MCHPPSGIRHPPSAIRHLPSVICHLPSAICHPPFPHSPFRIPHSSKGFERPQQLSVPGGLVPVVALECRAAIQRRAVAPLGGLVCLDFLVLGQQLLEPVDALIDDRADEGQRRGLIAGPGAELAPGLQHDGTVLAGRDFLFQGLPVLLAKFPAERIEGNEEGIEFRVEDRLHVAQGSGHRRDL